MTDKTAISDMCESVSFSLENVLVAGQEGRHGLRPKPGSLTTFFTISLSWIISIVLRKIQRELRITFKRQASPEEMTYSSSVPVGSCALTVSAILRAPFVSTSMRCSVSDRHSIISDEEGLTPPLKIVNCHMDRLQSTQPLSSLITPTLVGNCLSKLTCQQNGPAEIMV